MFELVLIALAVPICSSVISLLQKAVFGLRLVNLFGNILTCAMLAGIVYKIATEGAFSISIFFVDQLSAILLMVVAALSFTATLFSFTYMEKELEHGHISFEMLPRYYALLNIFVFTMISVLLVRNIGLMWVAIEATTLASALLVAFYFNRSALEAAWKYVMVCTVGICLALLGIIILYYAQVNALGEEREALDWLVLKNNSSILDPKLIKLAFVFILIGYGTKAGLAPMHTWLPDAHSQAPSPVSGLLSGALLSCALYAMIRNMIIVQGAIGFGFIQYLLIGFGILSIVIAIPFILMQSDIKRLLAYSSVEHMGIITVALGIATPIAAYGALLHIINHAAAKSVLFYLAGTITQEYETKHIIRIRGMITAFPLLGTLFIICILAITGSPPFGVFVSKAVIVWAAFQNQQILLGIIVLLLLGAIFSGIMYYSIGMFFGQPVRPRRDSKIGIPATMAMLFSVGIIMLLGFYLPEWLNSLLIMAAAVVMGG